MHKLKVGETMIYSFAVSDPPPYNNQNIKPYDSYERKKREMYMDELRIILTIKNLCKTSIVKDLRARCKENNIITRI